MSDLNITRTPTPNGSTTTPSVYNTSNASGSGSGSGEVVATTGDGVPVVVEQGPAWLARLAYDPPGWIEPAMAVVVVGVIGLAALGYHRHGIDEAVLEEMATAAITVFCVLGVAAVVRAPELPGGYVTKVLLAGVGGWLLAQGVVHGVERVTAGAD